jgi:DNA-binding transcriptional ArsR family regulator
MHATDREQARTARKILHVSTRRHAILNQMVDTSAPLNIFNHMVDATEMNEVFHALAHDARRAMLTRLASSDLTVGQLAEPFSMSLEAASKHIRVLERAGLVRRTVEGRRHVCRLEARPLASAADWLRFYESFWTKRLNALADLLQPGHRKKKRRNR